MKNENFGYHLIEIPKGKFGELSKIEEEVAELKDAYCQNNPIMALVELADLYCAMEEFLKNKFNNVIKMEDLKIHADATRRAFKSGIRK